MQIIKIDEYGITIPGTEMPMPGAWENVSNPNLEIMEGFGYVEYIPPELEPYIQTYQEQRAALYPPIAEFVDAMVKLSSIDPDMRAAGQIQLDKYYADCLAVKAAIPKVA